MEGSWSLRGGKASLAKARRVERSSRETTEREGCSKGESAAACRGRVLFQGGEGRCGVGPGEAWRLVQRHVVRWATERREAGEGPGPREVLKDYNGLLAGPRRPSPALQPPPAPPKSSRGPASRSLPAGVPQETSEAAASPGKPGPARAALQSWAP